MQLSYADFIGKYNHLTVGLFRGTANGAPLIPSDYVRQLVQDIADSFAITTDASAKVYADITLLLANTDIAQNGFALVTDASADANVGTGWGLYIYTGSLRSDLAQYTLVARQFLQPGTIVIVDIAYDASSDLFKVGGGTGASGLLLKGNQYYIGTESTTPGLFPVGATVTVLEDGPGQDAAKHKINYG